MGGRADAHVHPEGHAASRPVDVPILIAAQGPKGLEVAERLGDGMFTVGLVPDFAKQFSWVPYLCFGTVLDEGEDPASDRVRAAAGPGLLAAYHGIYEGLIPAASLTDLPGGSEWQAVIEQTPERDRHLAVHDQHVVGLNVADQAAWDAGAHTTLETLSFSGTADVIRARVGDLAERGVTEIVYQPAGPDIRRELETFIEAARSG